MRLTIMLLFISASCFSQKPLKMPKVDLNIRVMQDSLVIQFTNNNMTPIQYSKSSPYIPADRVTGGNRYYLQLQIEDAYFYIYPDETLLTSFDNFPQKLDANSNVIYKLNFKNFFPFNLAKGKYRILLLLEYKYNRELFSAESNWMDFEIH